jgi:hypothetical protein
MTACVTLCAALCLALVSGCGGDDPKKASSSPSTATSSASEPTATEATSSPSETPTASASPSPSVTPGAPLRSRLLTAAELPGFNDEYLWKQGATAPEDPSTSFGTCQRFGILSIGAEKAVVRRFTPAIPEAVATDRAGELVATFPDANTARRAFSVLKAWRGKCADRLKTHKTSKIGGLQSVPVDGGSAGWYLLTYGPVKGDPDAKFFDAQGMTVVGSRIAMVSMVLAGQDYNYEPGQEPMVLALQRAAQKLR